MNITKTIGTLCTDPDNFTVECTVYLYVIPVVTTIAVLINLTSLILLRRSYAVEQKIDTNLAKSRKGLSVRELSLMLRTGAIGSTCIMCLMGFPLTTPVASARILAGSLSLYFVAMFTVPYITLASMSVARLSLLLRYSDGSTTKESGTIVFATGKKKISRSRATVGSVTPLALLPRDKRGHDIEVQSKTHVHLSIKEVLRSPLIIILWTYTTCATITDIALMISSELLEDKEWYSFDAVFHGAAACIVVSTVNGVIATTVRVKVVFMVYKQTKQRHELDKHVRGAFDNSKHRQRSHSLNLAIFQCLVEVFAGTLGTSMFWLVMETRWLDREGIAGNFSTAFSVYSTVHLLFACTDFLKVNLRRTKLEQKLKLRKMRSGHGAQERCK